MEFSFDVVQVAAGAYAPEAYHSYIGFKVAKPALERAFRDTYGIEMKDVFFNEDLAIATYRHAIATTIPEMTKVAWSKKRERDREGRRRACSERRSSSTCAASNTTRSSAPTTRSRTGSRGSSGSCTNIVPKIGPFRSLGFSVPTAEAERLFLASFTETRERFRAVARCVAAGRLRLPNTDFDTGTADGAGANIRSPTRRTTNCSTSSDAAASPASPAPLRANLIAYYGAAEPLPGKAPDEEKRSARIRLQLASLTATQTSSIDR